MLAGLTPLKIPTAPTVSNIAPAVGPQVILNHRFNECASVLIADKFLVENPRSHSQRNLIRDLAPRHRIIRDGARAGTHLIVRRGLAGSSQGTGRQTESINRLEGTSQRLTGARHLLPRVNADRAQSV
jgi:hypothetical protein